jgi:hypothetical protein
MRNGGKVKKGNGNNRGYIGHHITWDNKRVFLRSKSEFIYARKLDYDKIPYLMESEIYDVDSVRYKPDFFIYENSDYNNLIKIVEVKGADDKKTALHYLSSFKDYFNAKGVEYDVIWKFDKIITTYKLTDEIKDWIKTSIEVYDNVSDVSGEKNPMYGVKQKEKTKQLISSKAKERCSDDKYLNMMSQAQIEYWNSEIGLKRRKIISTNKKNSYEINNPLVTCECKQCSNSFSKRAKSSAEFCSGTCKRKWLYTNDVNYGKHKTNNSYRNQLKTYISMILKHYNIGYVEYLNNVIEITKKAKEHKVIPKNKGISLETIKKYNINL